VAMCTSYWFMPYALYWLSKPTFLLPVLMLLCSVYLLCVYIASVCQAVVRVAVLQVIGVLPRWIQRKGCNPSWPWWWCGAEITATLLLGRGNRIPVGAAEGNCYGSCSYKLHVAF